MGLGVGLGNPDLDFENLKPDFPIERNLCMIIKLLKYELFVDSEKTQRSSLSLFDKRLTIKDWSNSSDKQANCRFPKS